MRPGVQLCYLEGVNEFAAFDPNLKVASLGKFGQQPFSLVLSAAVVEWLKRGTLGLLYTRVSERNVIRHAPR
jgi:hypothetical protein